jgi:hypothetical protein
VMMADYVGRDRMYLEGMDQKQYNEIAQALMKDSQRGAEARQLKEASDKAFEFLRSLVVMPNQYCLAKDAGGAFNLIELEKIRQESFAAHVNNVTSCLDESVKFWFATRGLTAISQAGYPLDNVKYDMRPESSTQRFDSNLFRSDFDILGTALDRLFAIQMISTRASLSMRSAQLGFAPNFLDIPEYRTRFVDMTLSRLGQGVSAESVSQALTFAMKEDELKKMKASRAFLPKFEFEKDLLSFQLQEMVMGLLIPGKQSENIERLNEFQVVPYINQNDIKQVQQDESKIVIPVGQTILVISKNQEKLAKLAQSLMTSSQMRNFKGFSKEATQHFARAIRLLKVPASLAAADKITLMEYLTGFKDFAQALMTAPEKLQQELQEMLASYSELAQALNAYVQIAKLEQQAAIGSLDDMKNLIRNEIKKQNPSATEEQITQAIEAQLQQLAQMGLTAESLKQASDQAKQQLAQIRQQFSQNARKLVGEKLLTQDRLNAFLQNGQDQIELKLRDAELNRKDYEAQSDLILGFLMGLTRVL